MTGPTDTAAANTSNLPQYLREILATIAPNTDRQDGAALIHKHLGYKVSHRSLEAWPLPTRHVNGRAIIPTQALFEVAYRKFAAAPVIMSGRRSNAQHKTPKQVAA